MKTLKKLSLIAISLCLVLVMSACSPIALIGSLSGGGDNSLETFYEKLSRSQVLLDIVADDIYDYWYDCIYDDAYGEDINLAIAMAQIDNEENLAELEALDIEITALFQKVKDGKHSDAVKSAMSAYGDYYEHVVNVSGSFNSYSADKESLKKAFASALRELSYEL